MADIAKLDMTKLWASSGDKIQPSDAQMASGWLVQQIPRQTWNWFENRQDQNIAYMLQKGIPEWDAFTEYRATKSYVQRNGVVYKCGVTNTGQDPAVPSANWVKAFPESSAALEALRTMIPATDTMPYFTSATAATVTALSPFARTILDDVDAAAVRTTISAQLDHINLTTLSTVTAAVNALPYFTGPNTADTTLLTAFGRSLLDDADATAGRATLGLGDVATRNIGTTTGTAAAGDDPRIVGALSRANNLSDLINATTARTNLGLGSVATLTAQTTSVDGTASRVLLTGAFGLGATGGAPLVNDANLAQANGFYKLAAPYTNGPTAGAYSITVTTYDNEITQVAQQEGVSIPQVFFRKRAGLTTWGNWYRGFGTNNTSVDVQALLGAADYAAVRTQLGLANKAQAGANTDITSLGGLTTALSVGQGGTGVTTSTGTGSGVHADSPTFTGVPLAPTAAFGANSTQLATTAFVQANATAVPAGTLIHFAGPGVPTGYMPANGAAVSRTTYAALFAVIGTTYGTGDGSTTFNVPDARGLFLRGLDAGRGFDASRALGTLQAGANASHTHTGTVDAAGGHSHTASSDVQGNHNHTVSAAGFNTGGTAAYQIAAIPEPSVTTTGAAGAHAHNIAVAAVGNHQHTFTTAASGGGDARPVNLAVNIHIKY